MLRWGFASLTANAGSVSRCSCRIYCIALIAELLPFIVVAISIIYRVNNQVSSRIAVIRDITQDAPFSMGRINTQNTISKIVPMMITTTLKAFFRLRLEMDALSRLILMLSSVFIVRHFFSLSVIEVLLACWTPRVADAKGMFADGKKIQAERSGDFLIGGIEYPGQTRSTNRASHTSIVDNHRENGVKNPHRWKQRMTYRYGLHWEK